MRSLDTLMSEHRGILAMLDVLQRAVGRLDRGAPVPPEMIAGGVEFLERFADGCHHAKEEGELFPLLERYGFDRQNSALNALLEQHDAGRALVRRMRDALPRLDDLYARDTFVQDFHAYADMLREHIRIEDEYFYPLAAEHLSREEDERLLDRFATLDRRVTEAGGPDRYHDMLLEYRRIAASW